MELFEVKQLREDLSRNMGSLKHYLDIDAKKIRLEEIEKLFEDPELWNNPERAKEITKEKARVKTLVDIFQKGEELQDEYDIYMEFYEDAQTDEHFGDLESCVLSWKKIISEIEFKRMLSGKVDDNSAIVSINAGSGGTESQDWAAMLYRMLSMYSQNQGFKVKQIDFQAGEEAGKGGVKSVTFSVNGDYGYGLLKSESGVHRLVRISPFDSSARRHTSFASVMVTPEIDDEISIEIKDDDIRIDTFRASGAGGQHINKTDSAIRITHFESGIVVSCQNERSQHKNKETAFKVLRSRLYELERQKKAEAAAEYEGNKKEITWGSQIRSYVLHPYKMVKDHRTNVEKGNATAVLDGELEPFVKGYLLQFGESL